MNKDPEPEKPDGTPVQATLRIRASGTLTVNGEVRPRLISYLTIKDAKERVLQSLSGSGAASFSEIVTDTTLPFELASVVIGELETEGRVTVEKSEGLRLVQLKK
jgi:predicted methyltransferase